MFIFYANENLFHQIDVFLLSEKLFNQKLNMSLIFDHFLSIAEVLNQDMLETLTHMSPEERVQLRRSGRDS